MLCQRLIPYEVSTCSPGSNVVRALPLGSTIANLVDGSQVKNPEDCSTKTVNIILGSVRKWQLRHYVYTFCRKYTPLFPLLGRYCVSCDILYASVAGEMVNNLEIFALWLIKQRKRISATIPGNKYSIWEDSTKIENLWTFYISTKWCKDID